MVVFFQFVCFGWLLFRAKSLEKIRHLLTISSKGLLFGLPTSESIASGMVIGAIGWLFVTVWDYLVYTDREVETPLERCRPVYAALICLSIYMCVSLFGRFLGNEFIYFQF